MTEQLKPCPFCGSTNIKVHSYSDAVIGGEPDAFAQCHDCSVTGPNGTTDAEAAEAWNTRALTTSQPAQAGEVGSEWQACVKMPVTVHVRKQRQGEAHVSTREGITPIKPDDLIMRGVSGEEYPIGRDIFEQTYRLAPTQPAAQDKPEPDDEGPEFTVSDPDLNNLLNLAADMAKGRCNHDTGMAWLQALEAVEARLKIAPPQQAAGEPVGEVSAESILNQWMAECGVYLVEKMGHQWASQTKQADLLYLVEKAISYTHPAPGVPEGWRMDREGDDAIVVQHPAVGIARAINPAMSMEGQVLFMLCDDILQDTQSLAAAQAKGGQ